MNLRHVCRWCGVQRAVLENRKLRLCTQCEQRRCQLEFAGEAYCALCGCTEEEACEGGCFWVSDPKHPDLDVCSACVPIAEASP